MSYVQIPFLPKSEDAEPLKRCIEVACAKTDISQYTGTILMSHFLEELAAQVAKGKAVRVPGFGIFAAKEDRRSSSVARWGPGRTKPIFSPSRGFREEVRMGAPPNAAVQRKITRHLRNHSLGSGDSRSGSRVFTAMRALREQVASQANGVTLDD